MGTASPWVTLAVVAALAGTLHAATPPLTITLASGSPIEQRKKDQLERLAAAYDLKKFTLTRDVRIEQGAVPHSMPVLTLNGAFLNNDDGALSQYVHEQGHWVLRRHRADLRELYADLVTAFPSIPTAPPQGSGGAQDSYLHLVVILLEWQALEDLVGADRARAVLEFKQTDHYTALYAAVLQKRGLVESIARRHGIRW
jgi:hypothetical protein